MSCFLTERTLRRESSVDYLNHLYGLTGTGAVKIITNGTVQVGVDALVCVHIPGTVRIADGDASAARAGEFLTVVYSDDGGFSLGDHQQFARSHEFQGFDGRARE